MVKILHTADLHLDSPFSLINDAEAQKRRRMLRGTFTSAVLYARVEHIDLFLISGDVFDTGFATQETMNIICNECGKNPDIRFIIAPGNHDPFSPSSPWAKTRFPSNVYVFSSPYTEKLSFDDLNTDVYGWAFTSDTMTDCPASPQLNPSRINILCAHADTSGGSKYCPMTEEYISSSGFDYIALGHIHKPSENVMLAGNTYYAYSGCIEGRSFDECGKKSAIIGEFSKENGKFSPRFSAKSFTNRRFERLDIDVTGALTVPELISKLESAVHQAAFDDSVSLRAVLKGSIPSSLIMSTEVITENIKGLGYLELTDKTSPTLDRAVLEADAGIRGAFYRSLLPMLNSDSEEERKTAEKALKYGLSALGSR